MRAFPDGPFPDMYNDAGSVPEPQPIARESVPARPEPDPESAMLFCPVCSVRLESRKCKLFCGRCGYYLSCADYY